MAAQIMKSKSPVALEKREIISYRPLGIDEFLRENMESKGEKYIPYLMALASFSIMVAYSFYSLSMHRALAGFILFCSLILGASIAMEERRFLYLSLFFYSIATLLGFSLGAELIWGFINALSIVMMAYLSKEE